MSFPYLLWYRKKSKHNFELGSGIVPSDEAAPHGLKGMIDSIFTLLTPKPFPYLKEQRAH